MALRGWRFALVLLLVFVAIEGSTILIWWWGYSTASHQDSARLPLGFAGSALPLALTMFLVTRRWRDSHPRLLAAMVAFSPVASALVATLVAWSSDTGIPASALNFPFLGCSLGWQLGGGFRVGGED